MSKIYCTICGSEMIPLDPKKPIGMTCPNCGWGWATQYISPIHTDQTDYKIILLAGNPVSLQVLRVLQKMTGLNFLQLKEIIETAPSFITSENAYQIRPFMKMLDDAGVLYRVEPEFPYTDDDE